MVLKQIDVVTSVCEILIVGYKKKASSLFSDKIQQKLLNLSCILFIKGTCRLIGKDDLRTVHQGPADCDSLFLTAGELSGNMVHPVGKSQTVEKFHCPVLAFLFLFSGYQCRSHDVLQSSEILQKKIGLENEANMKIPECGSVPVIKSSEIGSVAEDLAFRGAVQTTCNMQECAFSASAFSDYGCGLTLDNSQIDVAEDGYLTLTFFSGSESLCYGNELNRLH